MELSHVIRLLFTAANMAVMFLTNGGIASFSSGCFVKKPDTYQYRIKLITLQVDSLPRTCGECASICLDNRQAMPLCKGFKCYTQTRSVLCKFYEKSGDYPEVPLDNFYSFKANGMFHTITLRSRQYSIYLSPGRNTFTEARTHCQKLGAHLLQFDTLDEYHALMMVAGEQLGGGGFVGMTDLGTEGAWVTDRDRLPLNLDVIQWAADEPNGLLNENCGYVFFLTGLITDVPCQTKRKFLCERDTA